MADIDVKVGATIDEVIAAFSKTNQEAAKMVSAMEQSFARLSVALNNGTKTTVAQQSIKSLDDMLKRGSITADQYGAAINQIQLKSGLASAASQDAAARLIDLNRRFESGKISADQYAAGIANIQKELGSASPKAHDLGRSIVVLNQGIELAGRALEGLKKAFDFAKQGAEVARLRAAFENLGKSEADLNQLRAASLGAINDQNLMLAANRANLLHVTASTDELAKLLQVAAVRGRAMGVDTTQAFNDIVTGIGRVSPRILDNIGIITESTETYAKYAAAIGKTADELTDAEKRQALLNKVITESAKLGPLLEDQAVKYERLQAKLDNLGLKAGEVFADVLTPVVENATNTIDNLTRLFTPATTKAEEYEQAITRLGIMFGVNSRQVTEASEQYRNYLYELQRHNEAVGIVTDKAVLAARAQAEAAAPVSRLTNEYRALQEQIGSQSSALDDFQRGMNALSAAQQAGGDAGRAWNDALRDHAKALKEAEEAERAATQAAADYAIQNSRFIESFKEFDALTGARQTISDLEDQLRADPENKDRYAAKIRALKYEFGLITPEMESSAAAFKALEALWMSGQLSTDSYAAALGRIKQAAADGKVSVDELGLKTGEAAAYMTLSAGNAKTAQERIVNDARTAKERLMDEMGNALAETETNVGRATSSAMLTVANSARTTKSVVDDATDEISRFWQRVPTEWTTVYTVEVHGQIPLPSGGSGRPATGNRAVPQSGNGGYRQQASDLITPRGNGGLYLPIWDDRPAGGRQVWAEPSGAQRPAGASGPLVGTLIVQAGPGMNENDLARRVVERLGSMVRAARGNGYGAMGA